VAFEAATSSIERPKAFCEAQERAQQRETLRERATEALKLIKVSDLTSLPSSERHEKRRGLDCHLLVPYGQPICTVRTRRRAMKQHDWRSEPERNRLREQNLRVEKAQEHLRQTMEDLHHLQEEIKGFLEARPRSNSVVQFLRRTEPADKRRVG
jgi:hypothetical protein